MINQPWWVQREYQHQREPEPEPAPLEVDPQPSVLELKQELAGVRDELVAAKELARKYAVKAHDAEVDVERAKQRIEREAAKENEQRRRTFLIGFLDVLDNLERALESARSVGDDAVVHGVELVHRDFVAKLAEYGVAPFESVDARFDPERHQALARVPVDRPDQDGVVVAVIQQGYAIGGEILRPASVAVGQLRLS